MLNPVITTAYLYKVHNLFLCPRQILQLTMTSNFTKKSVTVISFWDIWFYLKFFKILWFHLNPNIIWFYFFKSLIVVNINSKESSSKWQSFLLTRDENQKPHLFATVSLKSPLYSHSLILWRVELNESVC